MKEYNKIAIIGMSGRFPKSDNLKEFEEILSNGIDCIGQLSDKRKQQLNLQDNIEYVEAGYLKDVSCFDYKFFNMSKHEAVCLDPQQRIMLELACEAIESSGYSLKSMRETNTAVIIGAHESGYNNILMDDSGFSFVGNLKAAMAGKISYYLDLRGDASVVDTSCSSSLYAIHDACIKLNSYEVDTALAGGIAVNFHMKEKSYLDNDPLGLSAKDSRCKTFDEEADGISAGEGGGFVFLKRLEDAIKDNDNILAVISGSAVNQDGARSNSMAAPSSKAQTEAILMAWKRADLNPEELGYIEAHGTGTKIGDPIEIKGLTDAFNKYTDRKGFCPIGSVKTNIAHLGAAAGIASVIKGVLAIENKKLYPLVNFKNRNSLIDFENSAVYPIEKLDKWDTDKTKNLAISSFGISGTNVHLVLSEYKNSKSSYNEEKEYIATISAKDKNLIKNYKNNIRNFLLQDKNYAYNIADMTYTLNFGRDDYTYRAAAKVKNLDELIEFLEEDDIIIENKDRKLIFLCSGDEAFDEDTIETFRANFDAFDKAWKDIEQYMDFKVKSLINVAFYICMYKLWVSLGIKPTIIIGTGLGNLVVDLIRNKISIEEAAKKIIENKFGAFQLQDFYKAIENLSKENEIVFVELGKQGKLIKAIKDNNSLVNVFALPSFTELTSPLDTLSELYKHGINIDWDVYYDEKHESRIYMPTYPFEKIDLWPEKIKVKEKNTMGRNQIDKEDIEEFLKALWCKELEVDKIGLEDDFFDLGANSLVAVNILSAIEEKTGVKLEFDLLYDYCNIVLLKEYIEKNIVKEETENKTNCLIKVERKEKMELSYNQRRMLYLMQQNTEGYAYNMPVIFRIQGDLKVEAFIKSVKEIVRRHEVLHTIYEINNGNYFQNILDTYKFEMQYIDEAPTSFKNILNKLEKEAIIGFNLLEELPIRSKLIKVNENEYVWFINIHHIAADGWSVGVFSNELHKFYSIFSNNSINNVSEIKLQYVDYAYWQQNFLKSDEAKKQIEYWINQLNSIPEFLNFPIDKKRPKLQSFNGESLNFEIDELITKKVKTFVKEHNISLFMLMQSIYALELYRYSNQKDICVGVPVANRKQEQIKGLVGFFANTVVIRTIVDEEDKFIDYIQKQKNIIKESYNNQDVPFEEIVQKIDFKRNSAYSPVFQYCFTLQNYKNGSFKLNNLNIESIDWQSTSSKFEMSMTLYEEESKIKGIIEYNTDLFKRETVLNFAETYKFMINYLLNNPETILKGIPIQDEKNISNIYLYDCKDYEF